MKRLLSTSLLLVVACSKPSEQTAPPPPVAVAQQASATDGVARGKQLMGEYACVSCHVIPGFDVGGSLGPSMEGWGKKETIVQKFPNTPANLAQWIINPQSLDPDTTMPPSGMTDGDARDAAAFLLSLK
jgi:cytochrome c1